MSRNGPPGRNLSESGGYSRPLHHSRLSFRSLVIKNERVEKYITMKSSTLLSVSFALVGFASPSHAGTTYQATGPVLEVTDTKIVIQKDTEKWEFARSADTKVTGELKVGSKVTVQYTMTAASVEVKPDKNSKPEKPAAPAKPDKKK